MENQKIWDALFGGRSAKRVLMYLAYRGESYAQEIARHYDTPINLIQRQLKRLEAGGILLSRKDPTSRIRWVQMNAKQFPWLRDLAREMREMVSARSNVSRIERKKGHPTPIESVD